MKFPWRAAIFDMDGTLACSMDVWRQIDILFLKKRGIPMPDDYGAALRTRSYQEAAAYTIQRFALQESVQDVIQEWHDMAVYEYGHTIGLKRGAELFIKELRRQGVKVALATVSSRELYEPLLRNTGIRQYFDVCVDTSQVKRGKGYPDVYLFAAQELSRIAKQTVEPADCMVFEDVLQAVLAARSGGFQTCGVYDASSGEEWTAIQDAADMAIVDFTQLMGDSGQESDSLQGGELNGLLKNGRTTCNCKKKKCERHGRCADCIEHHKNHPRYKAPYCQQKKAIKG